MTFSAAVTRDESVLVSFEGRHVVALAGAEARRVIERLESAEDEVTERMVLAKATGNLERGNER